MQILLSCLILIPVLLQHWSPVEWRAHDLWGLCVSLPALLSMSLLHKYSAKSQGLLGKKVLPALASFTQWLGHWPED